MPSRLEFDLNPRPRVTPRHNPPMRLLVMGNFSGQPSADKLPLASRPTLRVDADTLDEAAARSERSVDRPRRPKLTAGVSNSAAPVR